MAAQPARETNLDQHFEFGRNWEKFVAQLSEISANQSIEAIQRFMQRQDLRGLSFLDIGCGSGLSSLAACRLGAKSILSVDIDPKNIASVQNLKAKFEVPS